MNKRRIFISYRTDDSWAAANLIHQRLAHWFGADQVFLDVQRIELGDTWRKVLAAQLAQADTVLVIIGRRWLTITDDAGQRRLERDDDVVRWEVAEALAHGKRVIPTLIDSAELPKAEELPQSLTGLAELQARPLGNREFNKDIDALVEALEGRGRLVDELQRLLKLLKSSVWLMPSIVLSIALFLWVSFFDFLGLDTRMASATMALGDVIANNEPPDTIRLVAFRPEPRRPLAPSGRRDYARLITLLAHAGAARIAFDLQFKSESPFDEELVAAATEARKLGTQVFVGFSDLNAGAPKTLETLRQSVDLGFLCIQERLGEATGEVLVFRHGEALFPGLALLAAKGPLHIDRLGAAEFDARDANGHARGFGYSVRETFRGQPHCPAVADGDEAALLNFPITPLARLRSPGRRHTAQAVLAASANDLQSNFAAKVVLVGIESEDDRKTTHLDWGGATRFGYEFHADATSALLRGDVVTVPGVWAQWAVMMVLACVGLGLRLAYFRSAATRWFYLLLAAASCTGLSLGLYLYWRIQMNLMYQWAALFVAYSVFGLVERRLSREV